MKTKRKSRQKKYHEMLNSSRNCVADELMFTATHEFFDGMTREQIKEWADTCMEFVYNDLGYTKEQVLHSVVHLDEKTPHVHCVVVPLVKKLDNRTNTERFTISKKQYIRDKIHLSQLQDLYHKRLTDKGYDLERGIKGSDNKHIKIKDEKMKTTKESFLVGKDFVKVKKDTFDSMNNVIKESKKVMEMQPKLQTIFNEVDNYANSYKSLEKENKKYEKEITKLEKDNKYLEQENKSLIARLNYIFQLLKKFLRKLLQRGNEYTKNEISDVIKDYYDNEVFDMHDVIGISRGTTKQDELYDYVDAPDYYKERVKNYEVEYDKDDFELSM